MYLSAGRRSSLGFGASVSVATAFLVTTAAAPDLASEQDLAHSWALLLAFTDCGPWLPSPRQGRCGLGAVSVHKPGGQALRPGRSKAQVQGGCRKALQQGWDSQPGGTRSERLQSAQRPAPGLPQGGAWWPSKLRLQGPLALAGCTSWRAPGAEPPSANSSRVHVGEQVPALLKSFVYGEV